MRLGWPAHLALPAPAQLVYVGGGHLDSNGGLGLRGLVIYQGVEPEQKGAQHQENEQGLTKQFTYRVLHFRRSPLWWISVNFIARKTTIVAVANG
jgi:hypothetical protein